MDQMKTYEKGRIIKFSSDKRTNIHILLWKKDEYRHSSFFEKNNEQCHW